MFGLAGYYMGFLSVLQGIVGYCRVLQGIVVGNKRSLANLS